MKRAIIPFLLCAMFMTGCAGDFQSSGWGSASRGNDPDGEQSNDTSAEIQASIDRVNAQAATDAANAAAQAAVQETMNNANNPPPPSN